MSDRKAPVIKFLVTPVRKVSLPVVDKEGREKFGAQDAEHANDQGERQTEGKYPDHDFRKTPTVSKLTTSQFDEHHRVAPFKDWLRKKFIEFNETCLVCFQKVKSGPRPAFPWLETLMQGGLDRLETRVSDMEVGRKLSAKTLI